MLHRLACLCFSLLIVSVTQAADKYSAKVKQGAEPPKEVAEAVRKLLADNSVQILDEKGELVAELWLRKELPAKATEAQVKNGLTYRQVPETSIVGVIQTAKQSSDYRKQKIPAGVYTLRLAYQPMDGDHMGTAPFSEFCLISGAADDKNPGTMEAKSLQEQSAKTTGGHPGVFLLFPGRDAGDAPKVVTREGGHFVLIFKQDITVDGKKTTLGFGLTFVGHSPSA